MHKRNKLGSFVFYILLLGCTTALYTQDTYPGEIGVGVGLNQWNKPFVNIALNSRAFESLQGGDL